MNNEESCFGKYSLFPFLNQQQMLTFVNHNRSILNCLNPLLSGEATKQIGHKVHIEMLYHAHNEHIWQGPLLATVESLLILNMKVES